METIATADDRRQRFTNDSGAAAAVKTIAEIDLTEAPRLRTGLAELDRVLGGGLVWLAFDGYTASTLNNASFSQVAFDFAVTGELLQMGLTWALALGLVGGLFPALRAARLPITTALRGE